MPRKSLSALARVKTVKRNGKRYLYYNTGQKTSEGKPIYSPLGVMGDPDVGTRYSTAEANRTKRANSPALLSVTQLLRLWERGPDFAKLSGGTQKTYGVYLRRLEYLFEKAPAAGVETQDIYAMVDEMADRPAAAEMILLVARQAFRWGKKRRHVPHDPTEGVEFEYEGAEYEPWPEHLIEEALADDKVRLPVALLYFTGQRIGDVCALRWSDIRGEAIHVRQQKTGKELEVPVHSALAAILGETPRAGLTILLSPSGRKAKDQTIRWWLKNFGAARGFDVVPHGLRKNAVNALLEVGCSTGEVSSITGQSLKLVEHYAKRRNNPKMAKSAILKWERNRVGETPGKTGRERR